MKYTFKFSFLSLLVLSFSYCSVKTNADIQVSSERIKRLEDEVDKSRVTQVAISINGEAVYEKGDVENVFEIGRLRGVLVWSLLGILSKEYGNSGKFSLSDSLKNIDLNLEGSQGNVPLVDITLKQLLLNQSGSLLRDSNELNVEFQLRQHLLKRKKVQKPGANWARSIWDEQVLINCIEQVSESSLIQLTQKYLGKELGLTSLNEVEELNLKQRSNEISTRDLVKIGQLILNKGSWNGKQLIPAKWFDYTWRSLKYTTLRGLRNAVVTNWYSPNGIFPSAHGLSDSIWYIPDFTGQLFALDFDKNQVVVLRSKIKNTVSRTKNKVLKEREINRLLIRSLTLQERTPYFHNVEDKDLMRYFSNSGYVSYLSSIYSLAHAKGIDLTEEDLYGASGQCFLTYSNKQLNRYGYTTWNVTPIFELLENLGIKIKTLNFNSFELSDVERERRLDSIFSSINNDTLTKYGFFSYNIKEHVYTPICKIDENGIYHLNFFNSRIEGPVHHEDMVGKTGWFELNEVRFDLKEIAKREQVIQALKFVSQFYSKQNVWSYQTTVEGEEYFNLLQSKLGEGKVSLKQLESHIKHLAKMRKLSLKYLQKNQTFFVNNKVYNSMIVELKKIVDLYDNFISTLIQVKRVNITSKKKRNFSVLIEKVGMIKHEEVLLINKIHLFAKEAEK